MTNPAAKKLITILCPVLNEQDAIPIFFGRLQAAIAPLRARYDFELLFTNNRSTDKTLEIIEGLRREDPSIHYLTFARNFGFHASLTGGLHFAAGDAILMIDTDCEDPPEMIPQLVAEWENGYDIVYGKRDERAEPRWVHWGKKLYYRVNRLVADSEIVLDMGEFMLMTSRVRDATLDNLSTFPYVRTEVAYVGFPRKAIPMSRQKRVAGVSHVNVIGMFTMAIGSILSTSTLPLRVAGYIAVPLLLANLWLVTRLMMSGEALGMMMMVFAFDLSYLVFFMAVACLYIARIYKNGVRRPLFIVDWQLSAIGGLESGDTGVEAARFGRIRRSRLGPFVAATEKLA